MPKDPSNLSNEIEDLVKRVFMAGQAFEREDLETGKHLFLLPDKATQALTTLFNKQIVESRKEQVMQDFLSLTVDDFINAPENALIIWREDRIKEVERGAE